jgi:hypothetical protein
MGGTKLNREVTESRHASADVGSEGRGLDAGDGKVSVRPRRR